MINLKKLVRKVIAKKDTKFSKSLLIDDLRNIEADLVARNYFDGIKALEINPPFEVLYLDHDLASFDESGREKTGYDVMVWLENNPDKLPKKIEIVSSNPVGRQNIQRVIDKLYRN